jgi:iron complex outermembrane receptor protein
MFKYKFQCLATAGAAALMGLVHGGVAAAATAQATAQSNTIEQVVVTARKRAENLQRTPLSVSALSSTMIEKYRLLKVDDLQKIVPNLVIYNAPGFLSTTIISIRGISSTDYIPTNESPVAVYVDGVYVARQMGALFSLNDLERVEVLRGPQGTLNGRNATAGSVALFTKRPTDHFDFDQKFSYGSFNDWTTRTIIDTGELFHSGVTMRLDYMHHSKDGYIRNILTEPSNSIGAIQADYVTAALHKDFTPKFTADYKFDWSMARGQGANFQVVAATPNWLAFFKNYNPGFQLQPNFMDTVQEKLVGRSRDIVTGNSLTLNWRYSDDLSFKSITGYRWINSIYPSVQGIYPQLFGNVSSTGLPGTFSIKGIAISQIPRAQILQDQVSEELQMNGKTGDFTYVAGVYYFSENASENYDPYGSLSTTVLSPLAGLYRAPAFLTFTNHAISRALYGQVSYTPPILDGKLEITGGLRYTMDTKHLIQTQPAPGSATVHIPRDVSRNFYNLSGEGEIKYQWTPGTMTYFRVGQAYRGGGISARDTTAPNGFAPEKEISYEVGVKSDFMDHHVRFNGDMYWTDYSNLQVFQTYLAPLCLSSAVCSTVVNAGNATYKGFEAELTVLPFKGWELDASVGYVYPHYNSFFINPTTDIANTAFVRYGNISRWTSSAAVTYNFEPMPIGNLSARVNWYYHSKRWFTNSTIGDVFADTVVDPGYHDVGFQVILADIPQHFFPGNLTLEVYGTNLLDDHPVVQAIHLGTYATEAFGPGSEFGVSLEGKF